PDTLMAIADTARRRERLRFGYTSVNGEATVRSVEPYNLVSVGRHWYLVAWDVERDDWRTFRVDRMEPRTPTGPRFAPREPPDGDVAAYLLRQLSERAWPVRASVLLHEPLESIAERIWPGMGVLEDAEPGTCLLHVGADNVGALVWMITSVDADFTLVDGPRELDGALRAHAARCLAAVRDRA
ncbi:MAG: WYL domain-containing protein, partial [Nonomuraea sp.]|nr:WYL domain-containing protein [Nonomuraea sp.]